MQSVFVLALATSCSMVVAQVNVQPATPVVTEPVVGRIVNPADLHMECEPFSDPNPGDTHICSDWEVWTVAPPERVWVTSCIGGVERVHTHLGDGTFVGSYAGRHELVSNTQYTMRVRHKDSSNDPTSQWSNWGERAFVTGAASQVFALETDDLADLPAPTWVNGAGLSVVLPVAVTPPSVRLEQADGGSLLEFKGLNGSANQVINSAMLAEHGAVRVRVSAGSLAAALVLPETDLTVTTHDGLTQTIYLPALSVAPGAVNDLYFWVAANGSTFVATAAQSTPNFTSLARGIPVPWAARQPGYKIERVAAGFQLPVNIAFVPNAGPNANSPLYYVTELYGAIKVVTRDGTVRDYASNLLNFNPTGNFPGSGEQGVTGVVVEPVTGDVYACMLYSSQNGVEAAPHYPKVVRFTSTDGGLTAATQTTILSMAGETQGQSHQISNITFGPDDKLYVHMGDGFDANTGQNLASYRGKILRMGKDGSAPSDNPFFNAADGITSRDFVYCYGLRNPFGGAWRQADGAHYQVENGPSVDRFVKVVAARNYLYNGSDASMTNFAIYNWNPASGPVNMAFVQPGTQGGSGFPADKQGHMFISESGATWGTGQQTIGKKITEFVLDAAGNRLSGPTPLIEYIGTGKASVVGLAAGPDGLYFSDLYKDLDYTSPVDRGANILRVRFIGYADFSASVVSGVAPLSVQFTDASSVPGTAAYLWEFGDGTTSTQQSPSHTYAEDGAYTVRLTVTGSAGPVMKERAAFVRVGQSSRIALIGVGMPPTAADAAVGDHLRALGYDVTAMDDEAANRPTPAQIAANYNLVVVSSTIASASVAGTFRTVNIPMVFWENALLRSARESLTDNGATASATSIDITNNTHFITQDLAVGALPVFENTANMSLATGTIGAGAQVLARRTGSTDGAIVVANAGATVTGGYVTPARRAFLFFEDTSFASATPAAETILNRSVCWAMNLAPPAISTPPQDATACLGGSASMSVAATGASPLSYQWRRNGQAIAGATHRTLTIGGIGPVDGGTFDVVVTNPCGSVVSATAMLTVGCGCGLADVASLGGAASPDGQLTADDIVAFLAAFFAGNTSIADVATLGGNPGADGQLTADDIVVFLAAFFAGCP
ncbi:MAG: PQQ-dependent sugar dehydrogenase [Phycisphaerales bacterium]